MGYLAQRAQQRFGRKLATAFRPDALKFTPYAYAFGDTKTAKPKAARKQLSATILSTAQQPTRQIFMLGDDVAPSGDSLVLQKILEEERTQTSWLQRWVEKDELQRWLQIAATLSIPVAAAIWKMLARALQKNAE